MNSQFKLISKITLILSLTLSFFSCEKIIDLPLNESEQKVVIEASVSNILEDSYILLSKTAKLYGKDIFEKVNNGTVTITDNNDVKTVFTEDGTGVGRYTNPTFVVSPNNSYLLQVTVDGKTYSAESTTQSFTGLNFLFSIKQMNPGFNPNDADKDSVNIVVMGYSDKVNETNYYRFNLYTNGEFDNQLNLNDDKITNGQDIDSPLFKTFESKDTVLLEFVNMDKANYTYFLSLANTLDDGPFSATPANPITNLDNGALGYFGAYIKDTISLIIP